MAASTLSDPLTGITAPTRSGTLMVLYTYYMEMTNMTACGSKYKVAYQRITLLERR